MALNPIPRTPPTPVEGVRAVADVTSTRLKPSVRDAIIRLEPEAAPLTLFTGMIKGDRITGRADFDWLEEDPYPRTLEVEGAQTAGDTSIEVVAGQGSRAAKYYIYRNTTSGEVIRVSSVSTDTLTVKRGLGGFSDAMNDGDTLELLSTAYEEGSDLGTLKSVVEARVYNYTQTFRIPWGATGRNENADLFGGRDPESTRQQMMIRFKQDMEMAAFFGARDSFAGTTEVVTTTGGATFFVKSNVFSFQSVPLTDRTVVEQLEYAMKYGKGGQVGGGTARKYFFCSRRWATELEMIARERIRVMQSDTLSKFGLSLKEYTSAHGSIVIVPQNIFVGENQRYAFLVDLNHVNRVVFRNRDMQILDNRQSPGVDGTTRELMADVGWEWQLEAAHSIWILPSA